MTSVDSRCARLLQDARARWLLGDAAGTWAALAQAEELAGADRRLQILVLAERSVACVRAERATEALAAASQCLALAAESAGQPGAAGQPSPAERDRPLGEAGPTARDDAVRAAVADARVSHALARGGAISAGRRNEEAIAEAVADLDGVATSGDPALVGARIRAITGALVLRLAGIEADLGSGHGEAQAWIWVSRARVLSEQLLDPGTIVRQAVDLGFHTGQWARAWDHALSDIDRDKHRNEQVALLTKAAQLAWERGWEDHARHYGQQALTASVGVDLPWVRVYAYLGGVIAAAAGAGSVEAALRAYTRCTTRAGHATRPNRAWLAAQVALEAGLPAAKVRTFLDRTLPGGLEHPALHAAAEVQLRHREGRPVDPDLFEAADIPRQLAPERARILLVRAAERSRAGLHTAAAQDLAQARTIVRHWPGRVLQRVEAAVEQVTPSVPGTPAQRRVLDLLVEGWSNRDIAGRLGCSQRTVAVHVSALLAASGTTSRTELAAQELRRRLLGSGHA